MPREPERVIPDYLDHGTDMLAGSSDVEEGGEPLKR